MKFLSLALFLTALCFSNNILGKSIGGTEAKSLYNHLKYIEKVEIEGTFVKSAQILMMNQFMERFNPVSGDYFSYSTAMLNRGLCENENLLYLNSGDQQDQRYTKTLLVYFKKIGHSGGGHSGDNIGWRNVSVMCEKSGESERNYFCELEPQLPSTVIDCIGVRLGSVEKGIHQGYKYRAKE